MTSHFRLFIFLMILLSFVGCSNSLTTRGESQTLQTVDDSFPEVGDDVAQAETEDLSDEDFENLDEQTADVDLDDPDAVVAADSDSSDMESELDEPNLGSTTEEETVDGLEAQVADNDLDLEDDLSGNNFVTPEASATVEDPFSEFMSEDLDSNASTEEITNEDLSLDDLDSDPSAESNVAETTESESLPDSESSEQDVFEKELDNSFADVIENPITDDLIAPPVAEATNKLNVLEYNAQNATGVIVLKAEKPLEFSTQFDPTSAQFIINLQNVTVPSILQRPLYLKDFKQSFGAVKATPVSGGLVQVIVKVLNVKEPNLISNGKEILISPGSDTIAGKVSRVSEFTELDPQKSFENQNGQNSNLAQSFVENPNDKSLNATTLEEFLLETGAFYGDPINLQVIDEDIGTVISFIADYSGANIVISPDVAGKITLKLRNVPWDQALLTVMKTKGLGYVRTGNVLRIAPLADLQKEALAAVEVRKSQLQIEPIVLKVINLEYAATSEVLPQIQPFLTKDRGSATEDKRTSSIVLNDTREVVAKVTRLIKELDLPPPQVLVEAKIVEATKNFTRSIGIRWGASGAQTQLSPTGGTGNRPITILPNLSIGNTLDNQGFVSNQPLTGGFNIGTLDFLGNIDAAIGLFESDQEVRVISSPRITTLNNNEATILQASEILRQRTVINQGVTQTEVLAVPIELQLKVTPQITSAASVLMLIDVKNEFPGVGDGGLSPRNTRRATAKVLVESNKTAVIGGIYDKSSTIGNTGVPLLKDIPFLGWLFKTKRTEKRDTEIMIFITPRILDKNYQTPAAAMDI